jgi:phosphoglycolate phosphatase-like HAD superfamily hydrolase
VNITLSKYAALIFDCDGVVLDSNRIKTEAFRTVARPYGDDAAQALVDYHVTNGGISRYVKFAYFLDHIMPKFKAADPGPGIGDLLASYGHAVRAGLLSCNASEGLDDLRAATPQARWLIVSGGDQSELREVFAAREIARFFDGGIFGSPDTKDAILAREIKAGNIRSPAVFLGDSRLDRAAAKRAGLDFVFVAGWSEWEEGQQLAAKGMFHKVNSLTDLLET